MTEEELYDDLNETLRGIWRAGRNINDTETLQEFKKCMALAFSEGWDAESDDDIDYSYAVMA